MKRLSRPNNGGAITLTWSLVDLDAIAPEVRAHAAEQSGCYPTAQDEIANFGLTRFSRGRSV